MVVLRSGNSTSRSHVKSQLQNQFNGPQVFDFPEPPTPAKLREPCPSQSLMSTPSPSPPEPRRSCRLSSNADIGNGKRKRGKHEDDDVYRLVYSRREPSISDSSSRRNRNTVRKEADVVSEEAYNGVNIVDAMDRIDIAGEGKDNMIDSLKNLNDRSSIEETGVLMADDEGTGVSDDFDTLIPGNTSGLSNAVPRLMPESNVVTGDLAEADIQDTRQERERPRNQRMEQFRDVARTNAYRFARFEDDVTEESVLEENGDTEDWPGPFSSAMKIIRDRDNKVVTHRQIESSVGRQTFWVPKEKVAGVHRKRQAPSLQDLCLRILASNADAIASLEGVPDMLRNKLCDLLCESRRMNENFLRLLLENSPTEIRIKDCSWLDEDVFTRCFKDFDSSNLKVLHLDQCGRCIANYTILPTLARSSSQLPELTSLSLTGACRLTDDVLNSLLSAMPNLNSLNVSQCSLLTASFLNISNLSLASNLLKLHLNECEGIDAPLLLHSLKCMKTLEVLSLAGIPSVSDCFIEEFVAFQGHNLKELLLSNCSRLTDSSVKAIAFSCPELRLLDLSSLTKLTDIALGSLANGCRKIQTLKLSRSSFSDEAVAAFLETSGESLRCLSLNSITKVETNTALALAKCGKGLSHLDISWCRKITDDLLGLVVDSCLSLKQLKVFGCSQLTDAFFTGHSSAELVIVGSALSPLL